MTSAPFAAIVPGRAGIVLRPAHLAAVAAAPPAVGWLEVAVEDAASGWAAAPLAAVRRDRPLGLHGSGLSLGSAGGIDARGLARLAALVERFQPALVSDHLAWRVHDGVDLGQPLPLPLTAEALEVAVAAVGRVQDRLRRCILVEPLPRTLDFAQETMPEAAFLSALVRRSGCGLVCDLTTVWVDAVNHAAGRDPFAVAHGALAALPATAVEELHLGGHGALRGGGRDRLVADRATPVAPPVWELYDRAVCLFPGAATLIEWDRALPALPVLVTEARIAEIRRALNAPAARLARAA